MKFIVRNASGKITRTGICQARMLSDQAGDGETAEENAGGWNDGDHYYDGSSYVDKLEFNISQDKTEITADNLDIVTFSNIPDGSQADWVDIEGGLTFSAEMEGDHKIIISNEPQYKAVTLEVKAV